MNKIMLLTLASLLSASTSYAFQFELTETIKGTLDTQATVGGGMRLKDPNANMVGDPHYSPYANTAQWSNGDNGNLNYRKGDVFAAYTKLTPELLVKFPERFTLMARGTMLYDFMATETARSSLPNDSKDQVARDYRLLDLWVSKELTVGEQTTRIRVGNQVVSWGESVFALGGINQTNAMDIQKLMIPGTQLKEAVIPAPMVSVSSGIGKGLNMEAYYQFGWNRNRMPPSGSYWSIADVYDKGKSPIYLNLANTNFSGLDNISHPSGHFNVNDFATGGPAPTDVTLDIPWVNDKEPKSQGQYGVAMHYKADGFPLDLGVYFMNYHDKMPVQNYNTGIGAQWTFLEDRKMYGVSANFPAGNWAVGTELSYRPKEAIALSSCGSKLSDGTVDTNPFDQTGCKGWTETDKYQGHLTGLLMLTPGDHGWLLNLLGADSGFFLGEAVGVYFPGLEKSYNTGGTRFNPITGQNEQTSQVVAAGYMPWMAITSDPSSSVAQTIPSVGSKFSGGYTMDFNWTYDGSVIPGWQVTPGVTFFHAVAGNTPTMLNNYAKGAKSTNAYILFNMNPAKWQAGINYAKFFGGVGGDGGGSSNLRQPLADRDFFGGFVTYNF
jgi:hypothetical protein